MLQDNDPLWKALDEALKLFEHDNNHGGLISHATCHAMSRLRQQLYIDRQREARAKARQNLIHLAGATMGLA